MDAYICDDLCSLSTIAYCFFSSLLFFCGLEKRMKIFYSTFYKQIKKIIMKSVSWMPLSEEEEEKKKNY